MKKVVRFVLAGITFVSLFFSYWTTNSGENYHYLEMGVSEYSDCTLSEDSKPSCTNTDNDIGLLGSLCWYLAFLFLFVELIGMVRDPSRSTGSPLTILWCVVPASLLLFSIAIIEFGIFLKDTERWHGTLARDVGIFALGITLALTALPLVPWPQFLLELWDGDNKKHDS